MAGEQANETKKIPRLDSAFFAARTAKSAARFVGRFVVQDSLAEKRQHHQPDKIFTHNYFLGNGQKTQLAKTPINQKPTLTN